MGFFKRLFHLYISSSTHVALAVTALVAITCIALKIAPHPYLMAFVFFGTVTGYNFVKYAGIAQLHHRSLTEGLKIIQVYSFLCFVGLIFSLFQVGWSILFACVPLGLLTLFYAVPLGSKNSNLRTTPGLKIFVIAAVWSGATVYLPAVYANQSIDLNLVLFLMQRFLIVLALIIPFEIRDLHYDNLSLSTLPQTIGIKKTKILGYVLLLSAYLPGVCSGFTYGEDEAFLVAVILLTALAIYFSEVNQSKFYASFWVEGIPILIWIGYQFIQF